MTYNPRYDLGPADFAHFRSDLKYGKAGEQLVLDAIGALMQGNAYVEVKTSRYKDLLLFVEVEQNARSRGVWTPSGLVKSESDWVFFVKPHDVLIAAPRSRFLHFHPKASDAGRIITGGTRGDNPTRGFKLPAQYLVGDYSMTCPKCLKQYRCGQCANTQAVAS